MMLKLFKQFRDYIHIMARCPPCCLLTSSLTFLFISVIFLDLKYAHAVEDPPTTTTSTTTTTKEPFFQSTMFIGLAAGLGGFVGLILVCCVLWKCFCGDKTD